MQAQLAGTENRVTVARNPLIQTIKDYNVAVRSLTAMVMGYDLNPSFIVENEAEISAPPVVEFKRNVIYY